MFLRPFADNGDGWRRTSFNFVRVTFDLRCGSYFHNFFKKRVIDIPFPFEVHTHSCVKSASDIANLFTIRAEAQNKKIFHTIRADNPAECYQYWSFAALLQYSGAGGLSYYLHQMGVE